ncbi:MAG: hypothetical protein KA444_06655, partial [Bacteroidia bacterium]|nr:hypothetical protein [Bacteroidia bacterium]
MKIFSWNLFIAGVLSLVVFSSIFLLLQNAFVYENTLGKFSSNYTRIENGAEYEIRKVKKAYEKINEQKLKTWDADIYSCISKNLYEKDAGCYTKVKGAFFPLFPLVWKFSGLNSIGISILNYILFIVSIGILVSLILKGTSHHKLLTFCILISLPSTIIYYIPYTEALFLFTMTFALLGHIRNKYSLYFIACMAMAMLRPATLFILLAILSLEFIGFVFLRNAGQFIKNVSKRTLPFLVGFVVAILIQYASSDSFLTMLDAQKYWYGNLGFFQTISDWSIEGFGLNTFSVFFIAIPSFFILIYLLTRGDIFKRVLTDEIVEKENAISYFAIVSVFYLAGILIFILMTSGGNLHSFFRFTMASPAFYIALLFLLNSIDKNK